MRTLGRRVEAVAPDGEVAAVDRNNPSELPF